MAGRAGERRAVSEQFRAARRTYIRQNHPDRGGDPAAFIEGLQRLDRGLDHHSVDHHPATAESQVLAYRSRRTAAARWARRLRGSSRKKRRNLQ